MIDFNEAGLPEITEEERYQRGSKLIDVALALWMENYTDDEVYAATGITHDISAAWHERNWYWVTRARAGLTLNLH